MEIEGALREPEEARDLGRGERLTRLEARPHPGQDRLARRGEPPRAGRAVDAVARRDGLEGRPLDVVLPEEVSLARGERGERLAERVLEDARVAP